MHSKSLTAVAHIFFILLSAFCIIPLVIVFLISISGEADILEYGYSIIPHSIDFTAYKLIFSTSGDLLRSVILTIITALIAPFFSVVLNVFMAFPLSQPDFAGKKFWTAFVLITMLFSGGLIPSYIINTQLLRLANNPLVYVVIGLVGGYSIFLFRTFFKGISPSLYESAKIDGASPHQLLVHIAIPLSKPMVAMQFFTGVIGKWNDFSTPLYYITDKKWYNIQYLLQSILKNLQEIKTSYQNAGMDVSDIPVETMRFAMIIVGALPIFFLFPYIQKFFAKGISIGSVKG